MLGAATGYGNNAINQIIFTGDVDQVKAVKAGITSLLGGIGSEFAFLRLNKVFFEEVSTSGSAAIGIALGFAVDSGIPGPEQNWVGKTCPMRK